ncbi:MAG TPA: SDR family oxidoreductase [Puia sp.]|jgi:NAD(P)-dependent dehydrogenase (short-subunit alcohol dehydrogenase family)|nr:SDR family oxidoreductase [Puia sp.]
MNNHTKQLQGKRAVIFGGSGSIGSMAAKAFAAEGAEVFLTGRTLKNLEKVAAEIGAAGGVAHVTVVDALDQPAVDSFIAAITKDQGIDIVFNATGPKPHEYDNGTLAVDLAVEKFMVPVSTLLESQFITAQAAARRMVQQKAGVIIFLTGSPARGHVEGATAIGAAFGAIETFMENLAFELGPSGVRSVCLRTTGNIDTHIIQETIGLIASRANISKEEMISKLAAYNFLKVPATVADTVNALVFLASDKARMVTGTVFNISAGAAMD